MTLLRAIFWKPHQLTLSVLTLMCLLHLGDPCFAQDSTESDTAAKEIKKRKFIFQFDTRNSFVENQRAKVFGYKIGWQKYDKYRVGLGVYALRDPLEREITLSDDLGGSKTVALFNFDYVSIFYERILFYNDKWEITAPVQLGSGTSKLSYIDPVDSIAVDTNVGGISFLEATVQGHYKFLKWAGIGAGVGYRINLRKNELLDQNLSSFIYVVKLKIFLGDLYRVTFKSDKRMARVNGRRNARKERREARLSGG